MIRILAAAVLFCVAIECSAQEITWIKTTPQAGSSFSAAGAERRPVAVLQIGLFNRVTVGDQTLMLSDRENRRSGPLRNLIQQIRENRQSRQSARRMAR